MTGADFIISYNLKQQTPMIHFQSDEEGATLRASEVKPKLDRFLIAQLGGEQAVRENHSDWFISEKSLKYKMQFRANGDESNEHPVWKYEKDHDRNIKYNKDGSKKHRGIGAYFYTETDENKLKSSSYYNNVEMRLICDIDTLKEKLTDKDLICSFFASHNFGFRQNKGFGSFIVKGSEAESIIFAQANSGFYLELNKTDTTEILNSIKNFWQLVKNGINLPSTYKRSFLMKEYFGRLSKVSHLNDKKAMKLAILNTNKFKLRNDKGGGIQYYDDEGSKQKICLTEKVPTNAEYIRGLLGFANFYTFRDVELISNPGKKFNLTFSVDGGSIERFQAPVLFKPIIKGNKTFVYLIFDYALFANLSDQSIQLYCNKITNENKTDSFVQSVNKIIDSIPPISLSIPYESDFLNNFFTSVLEQKIDGGFKHV